MRHGLRAGLDLAVADLGLRMGLREGPAVVGHGLRLPVEPAVPGVVDVGAVHGLAAAALPPVAREEPVEPFAPVDVPPVPTVEADVPPVAAEPAEPPVALDWADASAGATRSPRAASGTMYLVVM